MNHPCPDCPDQGWFMEFDRFSGDPEQVQCEFCYMEPSSVFNTGKVFNL